MRKYIKIIIILIIIILSVIFFYFINKDNQKNEDTSPTQQTQQTRETTGTPKVDTKSIEKVKAEVEKLNKEEPLPEGNERFVITLNQTNEQIADNLTTSNFIKNKDEFIKLLATKDITSGGYKLSKEMTPSQIIKVLEKGPYMKWVFIKPGLRKEEIAEILTNSLGWSKEEKNNWIMKYTTTNLDYIEGVYYPDTYLIPIDESGALVAKRLINKFNENFSTYLPQFTAKNIKWTKAITLASIVEREAASTSDMPLIAGILWNRLNKDMYLGVDATLQYVRGNTGNGWWAPITVTDKQKDSPFNTYKYKGLPPHPIANPKIDAIKSVLNPAKTDCLYYIHDKNKITHCSSTYEEHKLNIQRYLVNGTLD